MIEMGNFFELARHSCWLGRSGLVRACMVFDHSVVFFINHGKRGRDN